MAEQIAEANFAHLDEAARVLRRVGGCSAAALTLNGPTAAALCDPAKGLATSATLHGRATLDVPRGTTHLLGSFRWRHPTEAGTYLRIAVEPLTAPDETPPALTAIVGHRAGDAPVRVMLPVSPDTGQVRLTWRNAYDGGPIVLDDLQVDFLSALDQPGGRYPLGAVGLIAADHEQVGPLLSDLVAHWPHYRRTALDFARSWSRFHNANRIVAELTARGQSPARLPKDQAA
jgi:hypothetical protein